ncbi:MAG: EamA family transporter [Planctomycetes bacterium]|nr:EamA family transporter [Planctomycetota bacterium]
MTTNRHTPPTWALVASFAIIYVAWGTTYLAIRIGVRDEALPPALFGGSRCALAGLLVLGFQALRGQSLRVARGEWPRILAASVLIFLCGNAMISYAEITVDSGVAAVLAATTPLWLGLFSMCWPGGDRLTRRGWLGLAVGLAGIPILYYPKLSDPGAFLRDFGPVLVLGSAATWALGAMLLRQYSFRTPHLTAAGHQLLFGGGSLCVLGALTGEMEAMPDRITPAAAGVFLYLLVFGSLLGFIAFNWLLRHVSANKVGTHGYVNPVIAVLAGWLAGEEMHGWIVAGIGVILFGVFLIRGGERPAEETRALGSEPAAMPTVEAEVA